MTRFVGFFGMGDMVVTGSGLHGPIQDVVTGEMLPIKDIPKGATNLGTDRFGAAVESYCVAHPKVWGDRWSRRQRQINGDHSDLKLALETVRPRDPEGVDAIIEQSAVRNQLVSERLEETEEIGEPESEEKPAFRGMRM